MQKFSALRVLPLTKMWRGISRCHHQSYSPAVHPVKTSRDIGSLSPDSCLSLSFLSGGGAYQSNNRRASYRRRPASTSFPLPLNVVLSNAYGACRAPAHEECRLRSRSLPRSVLLSKTSTLGVPFSPPCSRACPNVSPDTFSLPLPEVSQPIFRILLIFPPILVAMGGSPPHCSLKNLVSVGVLNVLLRVSL